MGNLGQRGFGINDICIRYIEYKKKQKSWRNIRQDPMVKNLWFRKLFTFIFVNFSIKCVKI